MTLVAGISGRPRPGRTWRPRVLLTALAALAAAAIAVTGCAAGSGGGAGGGASGGAKPAKVSLAFKVTHGATGPAFRHWTLRCDPAGGTHPAAAATCASLLKLKDPFAPPKHMNCPMILRTDRRIVVSGIWFGRKVHRVVLDGGCDMGLFTKLGQIFH